jgi:LmbE family N-acetylglucosaminyl deacetylase
MRIIRGLAVALVCCAVALAQEALPEDRGAAGLSRALKELRTTATVMHITAHPDDEDGAALTMLSRGQGARVSLLTLNRGEAGANLVSADFFDSLGALRTLELLKAGQYYGVNQYFTNATDYGFSKTVAEAWKKWGGQENVLREVTRIVRTERPDIIVARFTGTPRDGHGNHEAAGVMAQMVFEAAGDPKRFPEQIAAGLPAWQPKKLYIAQRGDDYTIRADSGDYDPVLGRSYREIAREGLVKQRSQGSGSAMAAPGAYSSRYKLAASKVGPAEKEENFFERLDTSLHGAADAAGASSDLIDSMLHIEGDVDAAWDAFTAGKQEEPVVYLTAGLRNLRVARKQAAGKGQLEFLLARKDQQFQNALAQALGLSLTVLVDPAQEATGPFAGFTPVETFDHAIPGQTFTVTASLVNRNRLAINARELGLRAPAGWKVERLSGEPGRVNYNDTLRMKFRVMVPENAEATRPYWRRDSIQEAYYKIDKPELAGRPLPPAPLAGYADYEVENTGASLERAAVVSSLDREGGQIRHTMLVAPALSVQFVREMGVIPAGKRDYSLRVLLRNNVKGAAAGTLLLDLPAGWAAAPAEAKFAFDKEGEEQNIDFKLTLPVGSGGASGATAQAYKIQAVARLNNKDYREGYTTITYPGLERLNLYRPAVHEVRVVDVKVAPGLKVAYVMGSGDEVPEYLDTLGVRPQMLNTIDLATGDLGQFDVILLGIRAYAARNDVKTYNPRLLEYVRNGGTLIVQYQTPEYDNNYGPFPYQQTRGTEETAEEDSPVQILEPQNPVFRFPNQISKADFDNWVEQRGSKFFKTWDARWKPLIETHDTGQEPQKGIWLEAPYGKGRYIYCSLAWYRQLPYAVPGAYRIVANLLSLPKAPAK